MSPSLDSFLREVSTHPAFEKFSHVDVHTRNCVGETALHFAAIQGDVEMTRLLLQAGSSPNLQGEHGFTPLHEAIQQEHLGVIKELILGGADLRIKNDWNMDGFELASLNGSSDFSESFRSLIETITPATNKANKAVEATG